MPDLPLSGRTHDGRPTYGPMQAKDVPPGGDWLVRRWRTGEQFGRWFRTSTQPRAAAVTDWAAPDEAVEVLPPEGQQPEPPATSPTVGAVVLIPCEVERVYDDWDEPSVRLITPVDSAVVVPVAALAAAGERPDAELSAVLREMVDTEERVGRAHSLLGQPCRREGSTPTAPSSAEVALLDRQALLDRARLVLAAASPTAGDPEPSDVERALLAGFYVDEDGTIYKQEEPGESEVVGEIEWTDYGRDIGGALNTAFEHARLAVPAAVAALPAKWRETADGMGAYGVYLRECADELEAALNPNETQATKDAR